MNFDQYGNELPWVPPIPLPQGWTFPQIPGMPGSGDTPNAGGPWGLPPGLIPPGLIPPGMEIPGLTPPAQPQGPAGWPWPWPPPNQPVPPGQPKQWWDVLNDIVRGWDI